jgi:DNA-binding transcriptional regulator WhiA
MKTFSSEELSYFLGFLLADGSLSEQSRNRGKISIELSNKDVDILLKLQKVFGGTIKQRQRDTNFKQNYVSNVLCIYKKELRDLVKSYGMITGKKSDDVIFPSDLSFNHVIRGFYDGDGAIGMTSNGFPFVSICTKSEKLKTQVLDYFYSITGKKKVLQRNKRDDIYNIVVYKEDAILIAKALYCNATLFLDRKYLEYQKIKDWQRPKSMRVRCATKKWTNTEDQFIKTHDVQTSMVELNRSKQSITTRLWRLAK